MLSNPLFPDRRKQPNLVLTALLAALLAVLLTPALASAATFTVDSTGDQPDSSPGTGGCKTAGNTCTLRAAIEEANASPGEGDEIRFTATFDGKTGTSVIALGSQLPTIEDMLTINGSAPTKCTTSAGPTGPCVGLVGPAAGAAIAAEATGIVIEGLSITGAELALEANEAAHFIARDNWLGITLGGSRSTPNESAVGIAESDSNPEILNSQIQGGAGNTIEIEGNGATVEGNTITGGSVGVLTTDANSNSNRIAANTIEDAEGPGVWIKNDHNLIVGNAILNSEEAGIAVSGTATENRIGSESLFTGADSDENTVSGSGGPAIELASLEFASPGERTANAVLRNNGSGNAGRFIDLVTDSPGTEPKGPNFGIEPPLIEAAGATEVSGTAEPEAKVRVYRKTTTALGEIEEFIGFENADESGNWTLELGAPLPGGTSVAASQTVEDEDEHLYSSELAIATTPADPPPAPSCPTTPSLCPPAQSQSQPVPVTLPGPVVKPKPKALICRKGFKKKKVGGKSRCVKLKKGKGGRR